MRKVHILQLNADIACNKVLEPRLKEIAKEVEAKGPSQFSTLVERFQTNPSPEAPPTNAPGQQTYDGMLLTLMLKIWQEAKADGIDKDDPRLAEVLVKGLQKHVAMIGEHQEKLTKELEQEEAEQKKKITSDDIHEGFDSHVSIIDCMHSLLSHYDAAVRTAETCSPAGERCYPGSSEENSGDHGVRSP